MPNKYFSKERRFWSKDLYNAAINPPNNFTIAASGFNRRILSIDISLLSPQTNIIVQKMGLFSNFADGLVWGDNSMRIFGSATARAFTFGDTFTGTSVTVTAGSKTITGVGTAFQTQLDDGDYFTDGVWIYHTDGEPATQTQLTVRDWPEQNRAAVPANTFRKLTEVGNDLVTRVELNLLNEMMPIDEFITPSAFGTAVTDVIGVEIDISNFEQLAFLTKAVSTSFAGDTCSFDVAADLEFTARTL